jgi:hypothetical protein
MSLNTATTATFETSTIAIPIPIASHRFLVGQGWGADETNHIGSFDCDNDGKSGSLRSFAFLTL